MSVDSRLIAYLEGKSSLSEQEIKKRIFKKLDANMQLPSNFATVWVSSNQQAIMQLVMSMCVSYIHIKRRLGHIIVDPSASLAILQCVAQLEARKMCQYTLTMDPDIALSLTNTMLIIASDNLQMMKKCATVGIPFHLDVDVKHIPKVAYPITSISLRLPRAVGVNVLVINKEVWDGYDMWKITSSSEIPNVCRFMFMQLLDECV